MGSCLLPFVPFLFPCLHFSKMTAVPNLPYCCSLNTHSPRNARQVVAARSRAVLAHGARMVAGAAATVPTCAASSTQGIQLLGSASSEPICAAQSAKSESNLH